jgi:hypothetical protein
MLRAKEIAWTRFDKGDGQYDFSMAESPFISPG